MANKKKIGLDYFPMEVAFFDDIKIRKLIKYQSAKAISVYASLLCNIYKNGYYLKWDAELPFVISEKTGYEEGYILEVINCCLKIDLFSNLMYQEHRVLTSKGIQERYAKICSMLRRKSIIDEFNLINAEEIGINEEELNNNSTKIPQRKGKEIKGKEIKEKESVPARELIFKNLVELLMKKRKEYFPDECLKWERAVSVLYEKLAQQKITEFEFDREDAKLYENFKKMVAAEVKKMWNWYHKTDAHEKITDWQAAMLSWMDRRKEFA